MYMCMYMCIKGLYEKGFVYVCIYRDCLCVCLYVQNVCTYVYVCITQI